MSTRELPTRPAGRSKRTASASVVLIVSASEQLAERCRRLVFVEGADLLACDLVSLRGSAAWLHPLAIVMTQDVRAFDPEGFMELSRRIGAELVVLPSENVSDTQLTAMITAALDIAQRRRTD
ncbi:hypothetical protein [Sorangium cellulosum]|uniref:Uncharacterized protein n=1 Tax=Sorangium cellulosum (strain So ce56) TaxID=448385 RepID=A9FF08_SORC5|nr:hypothetical protein [Sorangium cellulosum]CAN94943.1 hypothetical protein predicted by Glimmer/Critica [Sorangium cellulosum So ce56]